MLGSYSTTICKVFLAASLLGFAVGCEYHVLKQDPQGQGVGGQNSDTANKISADQTVNAKLIQNFVLASCVRCHSSTQPILNSLDAIKLNIKKIQSSVNANQMPPSRAGYSPLTDCEKDILRAWISENTPDESTIKVASLPTCEAYVPVVAPKPVRPTPPKKPQTILDMPLNYDTLNTQILQKKCTHCHNADGPDIMAAMYLFYPYSNIISHGKLLGTNRHDSNFVKMLEAPDDERMPPAEDGPRLTDDELEFVRRWIDAGHPEN